MSTTKRLNQDLLQLARQSINDKLNNTNTINKNELISKNPQLDENKATFVTLTLDGNLRGCIGTLVAHDKLFDDLVSNAQKAAFEDPRFQPLTQQEFEKVKVEISILSENIEIHFKDLKDLKSKINIGVDGMIIRQGQKRATFLPQVWEQLPDFEDFLTHLFHKAGITDLDSPLEIFVYQVEKYEEA